MKDTPDCSSALVTARMPSPWNSSPAPSLSFATSLLNDRSAMPIPLYAGTPSAIDLAPRHLDYIQKNISENIANRLSVHSRGEKYALDVHRRRGRGSGGIDRRGPGGHAPRRVVLCRGHRILEEFRTFHREGERRRQGRD